MLVHDSDGHNAAHSAGECKSEFLKSDTLTAFALAEQQQTEEVLGLLPRDLLLADALVYGIADLLGLRLLMQPLRACFWCLVRGRAEEDVEGVFVEGERARGHSGAVLSTSEQGGRGAAAQKGSKRGQLGEGGGVGAG